MDPVLLGIIISLFFFFLDIAELIKLEEVMDTYKLGPNGGLVYCMETLEKNYDNWFHEKLKELAKTKKYILIDCPGQVELYTHSTCVRNIIGKMEKSGIITSQYVLISSPLHNYLIFLHFELVYISCLFTFFRSLCAVHLVDAHYCSDPSKFVAVCLTALNAMLRIELPHINVLSKADLIEKYGKLDFNIDFYTEVLNLKYLIEKMPNDPFVKKHKKLNKAITGTILFVCLHYRSNHLLH